MFGGTLGKAKNRIVAVADIGSADAGVVIFEVGEKTLPIAAARERLPLEDRPPEALITGVIQCLSTATEKALAQLAASGQSERGVTACIAIVHVPWTRSFAGEASAQFEKDDSVTQKQIADLATQALANQKELNRDTLFEASVVRVLLNGYPTGDPVGKKARAIRVRALLSECDPRIKKGVQEALGRLLPGISITWRSSARAILSLLRKDEEATCLVVSLGDEATDILVVRKADLEDRALVPRGLREIATSFAKDKPVEETLALLDMLEKDQCESDACEELENAIAKAEPELAQRFGEVFVKLSVARRLPETLVIIAPTHASTWLSRFFSRIDFTQFTATARPFSPILLSGTLEAPEDPRISGDPGFILARALVNRESES